MRRAPRHVRANGGQGYVPGMKFSMIFEAQVEYGTPDVERQAIRNCVEQAVFAEEVGFDGIWAVEHHSLIEYSHMSAPEIFLTAVAAKTSRIRVGHAAVCMPFGYNHPARVAERAAMLDIISDGRLNLGAARGGTVQEMSCAASTPSSPRRRYRRPCGSSATAGARTRSSGTPTC